LLVPFLAVYILWTRRQELLAYDRRPSLWWGLSALVAAQAVRLFGLYFMYRSAEQLSVVLTVVAVVVMLFGWQFSRRIAAILVFLLLMLPWPNRVQATIAQPLQTLATKSAVFMLEMSGYEVRPEGHVINIGETSVAVAEACNGLRMITAFFVIGGLVVLIVKRAWWEKLIILISCLPIAVLCNTIRLTITSIAFTMLEGEHWEEIFHDFGGYAMMPVALAGIVGELWLLKHLTTAPEEEKIVLIERNSG
jgi:exosortase